MMKKPILAVAIGGLALLGSYIPGLWLWEKILKKAVK